ncbi:MAG: nucleotidyltransferase domain-containing protein [Oscillospiraceae bacterium]|jgi:predicted nucleotidyltransferase|nr:nucleotidyltransferase domain-containing protein [Oscillospiraceae bacterium]
MYNHHEESIGEMIRHYRENAEIRALFLIGSVATGTERPDSDIDGVAVVPRAFYEWRRNNGGLEETVHGKCTYEGGYFNIHYMSREHMEEIAGRGSEPMRNMFSCARVLYCDEPGLPELAAKIPVFPKSEAAAKQLRFYCTLKLYRSYYWLVCKPEGFMRRHVADGMVYSFYRLILLENEILFPSVRKLEETVIRAPGKPEGAVETCRRFMRTLSDEDCLALVDGYEAWTSYDFPKNYGVIMNHFTDPYEWG